jgi:tRNA G10  N-methylase Trm11
VRSLGAGTGPARFFYCPKPAGREIEGNGHPNRKPLALDTHLARLILSLSLRKGEKRLLVPFCGSGSEMVAGFEAGWEYVCGIENTEEWLKVADERLRSFISPCLSARSVSTHFLKEVQS